MHFLYAHFSQKFIVQVKFKLSFSRLLLEGKCNAKGKPNIASVLQWCKLGDQIDYKRNASTAQIFSFDRTIETIACLIFRKSLRKIFKVLFQFSRSDTQNLFRALEMPLSHELSAPPVLTLIGGPQLVHVLIPVLVLVLVQNNQALSICHTTSWCWQPACSSLEQGRGQAVDSRIIIKIFYDQKFLQSFLIHK